MCGVSGGAAAGGAHLENMRAMSKACSSSRSKSDCLKPYCSLALSSVRYTERFSRVDKGLLASRSSSEWSCNHVPHLQVCHGAGVYIRARAW